MEGVVVYLFAFVRDKITNNLSSNQPCLDNVFIFVFTFFLRTRICGQ